MRWVQVSSGMPPVCVPSTPIKRTIQKNDAIARCILLTGYFDLDIILQEVLELEK